METIAYFEDQLSRNSAAIVEALEELPRVPVTKFGDFEKLETIPRIRRLLEVRSDIRYRYSLERLKRSVESVELLSLLESAEAVAGLILHTMEEAEFIANGLAE